ncbi:flagellar motor protein MotB [Bacillus sp. T33-2]|uniref:flagellar motor protein MotB n=1 Tax=Bacillus sp. T33-2 TaxID=2054168 RepID=UPI000C7734CB|nr:flagellar motor protein MotB [Bacillus sp. T33-2]PLR96101.1 flagellar motor protein MotB [Bacillus sp. T33-2]
MSKRKKKHHHEEHIDESWLIPYSDLLTLLLALFIVLFAMSSIDAAKFQMMSKAFNEAFTGGKGVLDFNSPMSSGKEESPEETKDDQEKDIKEAAVKNEETEAKEQEAAAKDQQELKALQEKVNAYIQQNQLTDKLETSLTDEGLLVTLHHNILFASGSATVRDEERETADEIADLLVMDPPRNIIISGHTDNVPISNSSFQSNWELSVMRAVEFMKIVLHNENLDPRHFSAKGFGEFQPITPNDTEEGRAWNRRVEILILPREAS